MLGAARNLARFLLFALAILLGASGVLELFRGDIGDGVICLVIAAFLAMWALGLGVADDISAETSFDLADHAAGGSQSTPADVGSPGGSLFGLSAAACRNLAGAGLQASTDDFPPEDSGLQSWVAWYRENDVGAARADLEQLEFII